MVMNYSDRGWVLTNADYRGRTEHPHFMGQSSRISDSLYYVLLVCRCPFIVLFLRWQLYGTCSVPHAFFDAHCFMGSVACCHAFSFLFVSLTSISHLSCNHLQQFLDRLWSNCYLDVIPNVAKVAIHADHRKCLRNHMRWFPPLAVERSRLSVIVRILFNFSTT